MFSNFLEKISEIPSGISEAIAGLIASPVSIALLVLLILAGVLFARFSKITFTPKVMTHVGVAVTMAIVLDMFVLFKMPQGGSVTLASMAPLFFIAFIYGPNIGVLAGLIFGVLNLLLGGFIMHPIQVLMDYPIPFMLLGIAGYFPKHMNVGMLIAALLRLTSHIISGYVFFGQYAPEGMNPMVYSIIYNGSFLAVDLIIAMVVMNLLPINKLGSRIMGRELNLKYW